MVKLNMSKSKVGVKYRRQLTKETDSFCPEGRKAGLRTSLYIKENFSA